MQVKETKNYDSLTFSLHSFLFHRFDVEEDEQSIETKEKLSGSHLFLETVF